MQAYDRASDLGADKNRVFAWGCSAGGTLSCGLARRLAEKGLKGKLKGIMNLAGGTMHPDHVPERLKAQYRAVYENAEGVPIVDRHVMDVFNGRSSCPILFHGFARRRGEESARDGYRPDRGRERTEVANAELST